MDCRDLLHIGCIRYPKSWGTIPHWDLSWDIFAIPVFFHRQGVWGRQVQQCKNEAGRVTHFPCLPTETCRRYCQKIRAEISLVCFWSNANELELEQTKEVVYEPPLKKRLALVEIIKCNFEWGLYQWNLGGNRGSKILTQMQVCIEAATQSIATLLT